MQSLHSATAAQHELLARHLTALFGPFDPELLALLERHVTWVEVAGGDTLMTQGEPGDAMYLSVTGRLRVYVREPDGSERKVRDLPRGEIVGEISLYTDEPRSATVVAIRDSVLVRLDRDAFQQMLRSSADVSIALTRRIIERLRTEGRSATSDKPVTMALVPITAGVATGDFAQRLAAPLGRAGRVCVVDAAAIDAALGTPGIAQCAPADGEANRRIALHLDELEAAHDQVLLVADDGPTEWTQRCGRRADEVLLLADADQPPALHETERSFLDRRPARSEAGEVLVLLHRADRRTPSGTRAWLAPRSVVDHVHVRPALERDLARLARLQNRTAVGIVFAGGGARGLAHLGVWKSLRDRGIEIDRVGGTSIGAIMGAIVASDRGWDEVLPVARRAFRGNPTGDFNWLPLLSLIAGRRLRRIVGAAMHALWGERVDLEDLWKNTFCVATNYSSASELVLQHGDLFDSVLASAAIPGALPPVLRDGELLCDGGTFNNFPVDVMRGMRGVGRVIGADISAPPPRRIEAPEVPGTLALLRDRLRPKGSRRYRFPSLVAYLMNITVMYSLSRAGRARAQTDLCFNPPLPRVGMLQWKRFDAIVEMGRAHAAEVLAGAAPETLHRLGARPAPA
jgi:NTE family protein